MTAPTANTAIRVLVESGDLQEISGRECYRPYQATEIFDAVYGPVEPDSFPYVSIGIGGEVTDQITAVGGTASNHGDPRHG